MDHNRALDKIKKLLRLNHGVSGQEQLALH